MNIVIYVEKSSAAKAIAFALNAGKRIVKKDLTKKKLGVLGYWDFTWKGNHTYIIYGSGHLAGLCDAKVYDENYAEWNIDIFPCLPKHFELSPNKATIDFYNFAKEMFNDADLIISATDPDREGEVVFDYIYNSMNCKKKWLRAWLPSDLTPEKIRKTFNNLEEPTVHLPLTLAGKARSCADWLVGINLTVANTLKFGGEKHTMNTGRLQTLMLYLIVERTREIEKFVSVPFWTIKAECFNVERSDDKFAAALINPKHFFDKNEAEKVLNACNTNVSYVKNIESSQRTLQKPLLYNSTNLQIEMNKKYGYTVKHVAEIMESLYNAGYITYPRTDLSVVTTAMMDECKVIINKLYQKDEYKEFRYDNKDWVDFTSRHFNDKPFEESADAHTAVIPTLSIPDFSELSEEQRNVYDAIAKSLLILPLQDVEIKDTNVILDINGYEFKATGSVPLNYNTSWYIIDGNSVKDALPPLSEGDEVHCTVGLREGATKPKPYYTEGSLLRTMKYASKEIDDKELSKFMSDNVCGLGTGGTRPEIIASLKQNNMICKSKGHIVPTNKGYWLIDHLPPNLTMLTQIETTAKWEKMLHTISISEVNVAKQLTAKFISTIMQATEKYYGIIKNCQEALFSEISTDEVYEKLKCPVCQNEMKKFSWGYACSGYSNGCKFSVGKFRNKQLTENQIRSLLTKGKTGKITFKSKEGNNYYGALSLDSSANIVFNFINDKGGK